jgi:hypothetical protein
MRKELLLGLGAMLIAQGALAGTFINTRSLYQGQGPLRNDIYEYQYDFNTPTTSQTSLSMYADGGQRTANAWASFDPVTGAFKGSTFASSASSAGDRTAAWAGAGLSDVFQIRSVNAYEQLQFSISYDSRLNTAPITTDLTNTMSPYPIRHTDSTFNLKLSHEVANPDYQEGGEAGAYSTEYLANQTGHIWTYASFVPPSGNNGSNVYYSYQEAFYGEGRTSVFNGVGIPNGWNGTITLTVDVPTNKDLSFSTDFELNSFCFMASNCESVNDSTHSFYLDVRSLGGDLYSRDGYLGLATAPIPEPKTYAMMIAGIGLLGVLGRRRRNQCGAA